jgi:iron complex outermembrane receptor protein
VSFENAQAARIRGGDFDGSLVLLPHWVDGLVLNGGLAYLDAHYTDYTSGSGFDPRSGVFSSNNNFTGKRIVRTPKFTGTAALTKTWRLPGGPLESGADLYYNSGYYYAANTRQSAYPLVGARISYLYRRWRLRATLYGQNLNDRKYSQGEIGTDFGTHITLAPPRTFGGKLGLEF